MQVFYFLKGDEVVERPITVPEVGVLPGVPWGRPDVFFTAAYWMTQYWMHEGGFPNRVGANPADGHGNSNIGRPFELAPGAIRFIDPRAQILHLGEDQVPDYGKKRCLENYAVMTPVTDHNHIWTGGLSVDGLLFLNCAGSAHRTRLAPQLASVVSSHASTLAGCGKTI